VAQTGDKRRREKTAQLKKPEQALRGLPHSDSVQRIKNASNELSIARKEMARAGPAGYHYFNFREQSIVFLGDQGQLRPYTPADLFPVAPGT